MFNPQIQLTHSATILIQDPSLIDRRPDTKILAAIIALNAWGVIYYNAVALGIVARKLTTLATIPLSTYFSSPSLNTYNRKSLKLSLTKTIQKASDSFKTIFIGLTCTSSKEILQSLMKYNLLMPSSMYYPLGLPKGPNVDVWNVKFAIAENKMEVADEFIKSCYRIIPWKYLIERVGKELVSYIPIYGSEFFKDKDFLDLLKIIEKESVKSFFMSLAYEDPEILSHIFRSIGHLLFYELADPTNDQITPQLKTLISLVGEDFFDLKELIDNSAWNRSSETSIWLPRLYEICPSTLDQMIDDLPFVNHLTRNWNPEFLNLFSPSVRSRLTMFIHCRKQDWKEEPFDNKTLPLDAMTTLTVSPQDLSLVRDYSFNFIKATPNLKEIHLTPRSLKKIFTRLRKAVKPFNSEEFANIRVRIDPFLPGMSSSWKDHPAPDNQIFYPMLNQFNLLEKWKRDDIKDKLVIDQNKIDKEWWSFVCTGECSLKALAEMSGWIKSNYKPLIYDEQLDSKNDESIITILCEDEKESTQFNVHSAVLLACSPMAAAVFSGQYKESKTLSMPGNAKTMLRTIRAMYHQTDLFNDLNTITPSQAIEELCHLFSLADYLGMDQNWKNTLEERLIEHVKKLKMQELDVADLKVLRHDFCERHPGQLQSLASLLDKWKR